MAKLVAHEVEVATVDGRCREQAYHLVQCDTAVGHVVLVALLEVPVHIGIHEAEDDGLVAHECLVMALGIRDGLLVLTAVGHLPEHAGGLPVLVGLLLDELDPVVGHVHCHAIVEAVAAVLDGGCQAGHARYLLGNGDGILVELVDERVGQGEVADGIAVLIQVVVVAIATEGLAQAVAAVEHRGDAVEAEAVELILLHPEAAVREQEAHHIVLGVVEAE